MNKKVLYFDMDNVLVDFMSGVRASDPALVARYADNPDLIPGVFGRMLPMPGAIEAAKLLATKYDVYILSTASWDNPSSWIDKVNWVKKYLGDVFYKRLILSHHKNLCVGDYIIDDNKKNGVRFTDDNRDLHRSEFNGEHIWFGKDPRFMNWDDVVNYLMNID